MKINLLQKRLCLDMSQKEVAKAAGMPRQQYQKYEQGKRKPRLKQLIRVYAALNIPLLIIRQCIMDDYRIDFDEANQLLEIFYGKHNK